MTVEERLPRAIGFAAIVQQAMLQGTGGDTPDGFSGGVFDVLDTLRTDLLAIKRALPATAVNLRARLKL